MSQSLIPSDIGEIAKQVWLDLVQDDRVPVLRGIGAVRSPVLASSAENQQRVSGLQLGAGTAEIEAIAAGRCPGNSRLHGQCVPVGLGGDVSCGLERLWCLSLSRCALDLCAFGNGDRRHGRIAG